MGRAFRPLREWCYTCCTDHAAGEACQGNLLATGEERHGWRILVKTPFGYEIYGVLVAPSRGAWRSRVLTYPNILWILPDGGSIKFVGDGPRDAERQAIEFVKQHCKTRGLQIEKKLPTTESGAIDPEHHAAVRRGLGKSSNARKVIGLALKFGLGHVAEPASTDNLSEGGMFIRTDSPLPETSPIQIELEAEGLRIPLKGEVLWVRGQEKGKEEEDRRPAGMGVKLHRPPPRYIHFVRQRLKTNRDATLPDVPLPPEDDSDEPAGDAAAATAS